METRGTEKALKKLIRSLWDYFTLTLTMKATVTSPDQAHNSIYVRPDLKAEGGTLVVVYRIYNYFVCTRISGPKFNCIFE